MNKLQIKSIRCSCRNSIWNIDDDVLVCSNCSSERPYIQRKPKVNHITPSQQRRIDEIRAYFLNTFAGREYGLIKDEIEILDFGGKVLVKTQTGGSVYISEGASVCIGIRGGLKIWATEYATNEKLLKQGLRVR